ncbi:MAG: ABC transporter permease [Ignavibacteria bacterium]|nr:ABC transporter permease [Ignavibacteria bacterium]MDH7527257.1 ABC transporter permease [Ignavibacteria bacterium]
MQFIFLILKRFLSIQRRSKFLSTITLISILGVMIGVIVLDIALSVLNGFEREIENKLVGFNLHIDLGTVEGQLVSFNESEIAEIKKIVGNDLAGISPYAAQLALVRSRKFKEGVFIKGILPEYDYTDLRNNIIEGEYRISNDKNYPTILIGKKLARKIGVKLNDTITAFSLHSFVLPIDPEHISVKKFVVSGIYESGMSEYDDVNAFVHLNSAQELFGFDDKISGYEIKLKNPQLADYYSFTLSAKLGYPYQAKSIYQTYRNIFNWIELQKKPIPVVLAFITIVAIFNIISTLLIHVMDKTNSIGILKTLGATSKQIKTIFLLNGVFIGFIGTAAGNIIALILLHLQLNFNIIKIPEGIYVLDKVPISIEAESFLIVSLLSIIISILFSFLPARFAAKIDIIKSIRFS